MYLLLDKFEKKTAFTNLLCIKFQNSNGLTGPAGGRKWYCLTAVSRPYRARCWNLFISDASFELCGGVCVCVYKLRLLHSHERDYNSRQNAWELLDKRIYSGSVRGFYRFFFQYYLFFCFAVYWRTNKRIQPRWWQLLVWKMTTRGIRRKKSYLAEIKVAVIGAPGVGKSGKFSHFFSLSLSPTANHCNDVQFVDALVVMLPYSGMSYD